jgi:cysteinyl-tRNA synthetase
MPRESPHRATDIYDRLTLSMRLLPNADCRTPRLPLPNAVPHNNTSSPPSPTSPGLNTNAECRLPNAAPSPKRCSLRTTPPSHTIALMPLHLHNTLTRRAEPFIPVNPGHITFYTCGPTVYDDAHIGNFRSFLAADLLRRFLESPICALAQPGDPHTGPHTGPRRVTHVMNITDVGHMTDDAEGGERGEDRMAIAGKRLLEAKKSGSLPPGVELNPADPYQIARFYEHRFLEDARALGLKISLEALEDPTLHPRATDNVPGMIAVIQRLIARGHAYAVGTPGRRVVYFDVRSFAPYGQLSGNTLDALREGEGGRISAENQAGKKHPADFLLWKEDPSHIMKWPSPWGEGYPGWHIECTVMSVARLCGAQGRVLSPDELASHAVDNGQPLIDLHSGGEDNIFPHHECELAQSCCAFNGAPAGGSFAAMWFHPRFLLVEGAKMSKSKGNFFTARDLFAKGIEPAALRLELIKTHYRSNANFTMQGLADSQRMIDRWRRALEGARAANSLPAPHEARGPHEHPETPNTSTPAPTPAGRAFLAAFADALHDDLNIAAAIAELNTWTSTLATPSAPDLAPLVIADRVLGLLSRPRPKALDTEIALFAPGVTPDAAVEDLLRRRKAARASKDFAASDAIRDQLAAMGYAIKDTAGGKVEVRRA